MNDAQICGREWHLIILFGMLLMITLPFKLRSSGYGLSDRYLAISLDEFQKVLTEEGCVCM